MHEAGLKMITKAGVVNIFAETRVEVGKMAGVNNLAVPFCRNDRFTKRTRIILEKYRLEPWKADQ